MNSRAAWAVFVDEGMIGHTESMGLGDTALTDGRESAECADQFAALVERQSRFVYRVAFAVLRHSHDAEDVVQEVFLKLYRANAWNEIQDERAYLARVAWRLAVERPPKATEPLNENAASALETPEQAAVQANWSAVVHRLMDALPDELRIPLALSSVDELTSREIAVILQIPEGTVRTRMMKAREVLKEKLARLLGGSNGL